MVNFALQVNFQTRLKLTIDQRSGLTIDKVSYGIPERKTTFKNPYFFVIRSFFDKFTHLNSIRWFSAEFGPPLLSWPLLLQA